MRKRQRSSPLTTLADLLLGSRCVVCSGQGAGHGLDICPSCYRHLPWNLSACRRCGIPVPRGADICSDCRDSSSPIAMVRAPWTYEPPINHLIHQLKFHGSLASGRLLGSLLARTLQRTGVHADALIPTPLHPRRLRERGYNQAMELGQPVARQLGIPLQPAWVRRGRHTDAQASLGRLQRARNMIGAFTSDARLQGKRVALIDDVATTLATAEAMAACLHEAGCTRVELWVVARASTPG
jgi:ComF family protein